MHLSEHEKELRLKFLEIAKQITKILDDNELGVEDCSVIFGSLFAGFALQTDSNSPFLFFATAFCTTLNELNKLQRQEEQKINDSH